MQRTRIQATHCTSILGSAWGPKSCFGKAKMLVGRYPHYINRIRGLAYGAFRRVTRGRCLSYPILEPFVVNKTGLEIGGPSPIFRKGKAIAVYDRCRKID